MQLGEINVSGSFNVVSDPELQFLQNGAAVAKFRAAARERRFDRDTKTWVDGHTSFVTVEVWRSTAQNVTETLRKGMVVLVSGKLRVREFTRKDGARGTAVEIFDALVAVDLTFQTAKVEKTARANDGGGQVAGAARGPASATAPVSGGHATSPPAQSWAGGQSFLDEGPF